tara:strand:- start:3280 stop:3669 length:390 start_codon:yes stop_codon:yes gene_type:complete
VAKSILYRTTASIQEQIVANGTYYMDSDVGHPFTSNSRASELVLGGDRVDYVASAVTNTSTVISIGTGKDFLFVKCISGPDVTISLDGSNYNFIITENEAFVSEIDSSANIKFRGSSSSDSKVQYFTGT